MIGYVTIEVKGGDMDGAARHAQRLANNFLEDLDDMRRASRARDRRAMSHFEVGTRTGHWYPPEPFMSPERRRSWSQISTRSLGQPVPHYRPHYNHRPYYPQNLYPARIITYQAPPVMMVGKSMKQYVPFHAPEFRLINGVYPYGSAWDLPTSHLHAHPPVRRHIMTPGALDYLNHRISLWRSLSNLYDYDLEEPVSRIVHKTYTRRPSARLGSVPPVTSYRPLYYNSEITPTVLSTPRTYYRTTRYISESPYYLNPYIHRTAEPSRPILTTHYSTAPAPVTQRYTYYYPSVMTGKQYYPKTVSFSNLSPEVQYERRRIERRMDDLLDYKLPPPEYYREMRGTLRGLHERLDEHRRLLDRYSRVDMDTTASLSVGDRIESKYQQLASRMGRGITVTGRV